MRRKDHLGKSNAKTYDAPIKAARWVRVYLRLFGDESPP